MFVETKYSICNWTKNNFAVLTPVCRSFSKALWRYSMDISSFSFNHCMTNGSNHLNRIFKEIHSIRLFRRMRERKSCYVFVENRSSIMHKSMRWSVIDLSFLLPFEIIGCIDTVYTDHQYEKMLRFFLHWGMCVTYLGYSGTMPLLSGMIFTDVS